MNTADLEKIQTIFRDVLDQSDLVLTADSNPDTVEGWDSVAHVNIIVSVEQDFGVKFDLKDLQKIKTVADLLTFVQK